MLGDGVTSFLLALGAGTWVYNKFMQRTNSVQNSLAGAAVVAVVAFIFCYFFLKYTLHW